MCEAVSSFFSRVWAWAKAAFGHSKIVFVNVLGTFAAVYVELQDFLISFNWDDFFKHEVAAGIGMATTVISALLRVYGSSGAPVSFKPVAPVPPVEVIPDEDGGGVSHKAE